MPTLSSRLDQLASAATRSDAPGLALGVLRDGEVLVARGYGLADLAQHTPITEKTVFHLGSTSKQFVACGVALLAAQGALALNDDIRTYLPEMPAYDAPITLHHLIHHQSGLRECLTLWSLTGRDRMSCGPPEAVLALVARQQRLHFLPGAAYEYCNTNYLLLALIIERCSGQPLATVAQQRIFQPLGMISSVIADDRSLIASPQARGYLATSEGERPAPGGIGVLGAAGVFSSIEDLIRWDQNFAQPVVGDARLVADLQTPARLADGTPTHYAFGLFAQAYRGQTVISHAGAFPGTGAQLLRFPAQRLTVICLCNQEHINPSQLAFQAADLVLDDLDVPPRSIHAGVSAPHAADLSPYAGMFRNSRSRQIAEVSVEDGQLILALPEGRLTLAAAGEECFVAADQLDEVLVAFGREPGGALQQMTLATVGEETAVFEPVVPLDRLPSAADLEAYSGVYWCDELAVAYTFAREGDRLILRGPNMSLEPTIRDSFSTGYGAVFEFVRDQQGGVSGLWCSAYHAHRLFFTGLVQYATQLAEQSLEEAFGPQRAVWIRRLVDTLPGLRAALDWLVVRGEATQGLRLAYLLQELWFEEEHTGQGRRWFESLLALPQASTRTAQRAQALDLAGALVLSQGDYVEARALKEEGISILRELGDQVLLGFALLHLGHLLGYAQGDFAAARAAYQEALELLRGMNHTEGAAHALANLANVAIHTGDYAAAQPLVHASLGVYRERDFAYDMALSLQRAAGIAAGLGHHERALRLAGASATHCAALGVSQPQVFLERQEQMIAQARQALDPLVQAALWAEGQAMSLQAAVAYALEEAGEASR